MKRRKMSVAKWKLRWRVRWRWGIRRVAWHAWTLRLMRLWLMVALLASSTLPLTVTEAASRISITSLYVTDTPSKLVNGKPANDSLVGKVTSNLITLLATVEGFTDSELTKLYVTITNVTTDKVFEEKGIVPQKQKQTPTSITKPS